MLETISSPAEWQRLPRTPGFSGKTVGLVPTMGALHKGHISLVNRCIKENDISVVSIFINPTQFNNSDDFSNYPKTIQKDRALLEEAGVQYLFLPTYNNLYKDGYVFKIIETDFSKKLCGIHRPGHFDGVLTVVMKLLNIIKPDRAYFGEKDFQQLRIIEYIAQSLKLNTKIISCPIIREKSGLLAYSPLAGGFLTGKYRNNNLPENSRQKLFADYYTRYNKPNTSIVIEKYFDIAKKFNLDFAQMSIKFCEIQKFLTSVIIGATTIEQLKINIESVNVNLTEEIIRKINDLQIIYPNPCP